MQIRIPSRTRIGLEAETTYYRSDAPRQDGPCGTEISTRKDSQAPVGLNHGGLARKDIRKDSLVPLEVVPRGR